VATENVGYREVLSSDEGILVPPKDPAAFAAAIVRLLQNEQQRKEMGMNGRKKALRYSWDKIVQDISDYYQEILN
jgi:glycosyltransferase involved in cell wall biosynthesis